jgi:hypothetical protein
MSIIMEDYMFFESKVENWNIIIDTSERCLVDFSMKNLELVITILQRNFP